jgi:hypothetical protein
VVVTRQSRFGNPFRIGDEDGPPDAHVAVALHREWLLHSDEPRTISWGQGTRTFDPVWQRANLGLLRGKDLACGCALADPCHGALLLDLANQPTTAAEPNS